MCTIAFSILNKQGDELLSDDHMPLCDGDTVYDFASRMARACSSGDIILTDDGGEKPRAFQVVGSRRRCGLVVVGINVEVEFMEAVS